MLVALSACDLPFGLAQPATRALQNGAADALTSSKSFKITGSYTDESTIPSGPASSARTSPTPTNQSGARVDIELEIMRPDGEHVLFSAPDTKLEAIVVGGSAYFRGNQFLSQHMGSDPLSRNLVKAAGNAWWKGPGSDVPRLVDFTEGSSFKSTFLGPNVTQRSDHASVDGVDAVQLSGPRADVYIASAPPYRLLRVQLKRDAVVDGVIDGDFRYSNFGDDFKVAAPPDVIDFSNLSTLPPIYTVVSVDTSGCVSPCVVAAVLKNLGGMSGAAAPSTITFTMTDSASGRNLGGCQAPVVPDVGYNGSTKVSCTINNVNGQQANAAVVTATPDNPGHT